MAPSITIIINSSPKYLNQNVKFFVETFVYHEFSMCNYRNFISKQKLQSTKHINKSKTDPVHFCHFLYILHKYDALRKKES